jgi:histidine triad (HIT) family protein
MKALLLAWAGCLMAWAQAAGAQITDAEIAALYARPTPATWLQSDRWIAQSENAVAVRDINPQAPGHFLVLPRQKIPTLLQAPPDLLGEMLALARRVAEEQGLAREGFRIVINTHPQGGQSVYHLHMHILGGRQMKWPPG